MAWTTPVDYSTGQVITAAIWNNLIGSGGNIDETAPAKVTTAGDLVYGTGTNAIARLGVGTANQVLKVNSGATAPEWSAVAASELTAGNDKVFYSNSSGVVTELALGVSGEVLTSNGATSAPSFAAAAAGGSISVTASGAISGAGIAVALNSDGTVSTIADNRTSPSYGSFNRITDYSASYSFDSWTQSVYCADQDAVVVYWWDNNSSGGGSTYKGYIAAGSISGSTITFGSIVEIGDASGSWYNGYALGIGYDPDTYKIWVAWHSQSNGCVTLATATVSGTTVTVSASAHSTGWYSSSYGSQNNAVFAYDTTNSQMIFSFSNYSAPSCSWAVVSESGGTITVGTALVNTDSIGGRANGNMIWMAGPARLVTFGGYSSSRAITTISVSGTTLTLDQQDTQSGLWGGDAQYGYKNCLVETASTDRALIGAYKPATSDAVYWNVIEVTAGAATTTVFTNPKEIPNTTEGNAGISWRFVRIGTTGNKYVFMQNSGANTTFFSTIEVSGIDGTPSIATIGETTTETSDTGTINLNNTNSNWLYTGTTHNKVVTSGNWTETGAAGNAAYKQCSSALITPSSGSTNATTWLGISEAAISDGASGSVTIVGGTNTGVTGLTQGSTYFVQANGTLATTPAFPVDYGKVGPALTATSILIQGVGNSNLSSS